MKRLLSPVLATLALALPLLQVSSIRAAPVADYATQLSNPFIAPAEVAPIPIALLVDLNSGQTLFAKEADRRFVPASITKVMTLYVAFDMIARGQLDPNARLRMSEDAWKNWHGVGSTMFLDREKAVTVNDLVLGIANVSANDGCVVLAEGAAGSVSNWVALMNAHARRLGMTDSHFGTANGWMDDGQTYVSARDLATLAAAMLNDHADLYRRYVGHRTMTWNGITQRNHDPLLGRVDGADGIKTGFTNQAGYGFLGSAVRNGRRLIMVVAGADRHQDRSKAAAALINWGFAAFDTRPLFARGAVVGTARVQDGADRSVPLVSPGNYAATMARGQGGRISLRVVYEGPLRAPVAKGAKIAELEIRAGSAPPTRLPLVAGADVPKAGVIARLLNGLSGLVS